MLDMSAADFSGLDGCCENKAPAVNKTVVENRSIAALLAFCVKVFQNRGRKSNRHSVLLGRLLR